MRSFIQKWKKWLIGLFATTAFAAGVDQLDTIPRSLETKDIDGCGAPIGQEFNPETKQFTVFFSGCAKTFSLTKSEFNAVDTFISKKTKEQVVEEYIKEQYGFNFDIELDKNGEPINVSIQW